MWKNSVRIFYVSMQESKVFTLPVYWCCNLWKPQVSSTSIKDGSFIHVGNGAPWSLFVQFILNLEDKTEITARQGPKA